MKPNKIKEWEKEFDDRYFDIEAWIYCGKERCPGAITAKVVDSKGDIKQFISSLLEEQKKEIIEKIEKNKILISVVGEDGLTPEGKFYVETYNRAIDDILKEL